ncbi:MAG: hypothetical protein ACREQ9_14005 [Candidatus Binatia bacterium]
MTPPFRRLTGDERGSTIVFAMLLLCGFLVMAVAGLVSATSDLKVSRNYSTGAQALLSAEGGILHAQKVVNDRGVLRFDTDVVSRWSTIFGAGAVTIPGHAGLTYTVGAGNDPVSPAAFMILTSEGTAPNESRRTIEARLAVDGVFTPGAIYLPDPGVSSSFQGNAFLVDGNDRRLNGAAGANPAVPGVATATTQAATSVAGALNHVQKDNVIGLGGTESVYRAGGPDIARIRDEIVPGILAQPGVVTNPTLRGNDVFGTTLAPTITYFSADTTLNGTVNGAGILIVDGGLTINGNFTFTGLVVVRGSTDITSVSGNSTLLGALWTTDLALRVGGSASVTYSREALALVTNIGLGNLLPQRVRAVAWRQL